MKRRLIYLSFSFCGLVAMFLGLLIVFYVYAFASMCDPRLSGLAYWREVLKEMFFMPTVVCTLFGLILALGGAFAAIVNAAVAIGWLDAAPLRRVWPAIAVALLVMLAMGAIIAACS